MFKVVESILNTDYYININMSIFALSDNTTNTTTLEYIKDEDLNKIDCMK